MSTINETAVLRFYLDTQEYSDRLTAIEAQAASTLATQKSEVAAAIAQVNLTQSQAITALTLEVSNLRTDLTDSITATETNLINRADQLAQDVTDITNQLTQDKATFTQEIQDALDYLKDDASVASALRTPRKIQGVDFDGTKDISLPTFSTQIDGLVPKRVGATTTKYLREDGTWVAPLDTTYALLTKASAEDGTATTANTISAQVLKEAIQYHAPTVTSIAGNAGTATTLQTPRTINGTSFNGSAGITTTQWGTVRIFTLGSTSKSVNGSADVSWSADEILPTGTNGQVLKHNGTSWIAGADNDTTYTVMSATTANAGTDTTAQVISPRVLKQAIQTHAPAGGGGGGGTNFAAKIEIELETVLDYGSGNYHVLGNIISVSNQANIASAVIDSDGILCLTFNTPINNPNLIVTTKNEIKHVTYEGVDYSYLTSARDSNFNYSMGSQPTYGILQYAEGGYVNTNTKLYISCDLVVFPNYGGTSYLRSTFPARFNLGIIDA